MKLDDLRREINDIDGEMLQLFLKRMEICKSIALYKKENDLPIMQEGREQQVIDKVRAASPEHMADAAAVMFTEVMDISKCLQSEVYTWGRIYEKPEIFHPENAQVIACQGTSGAYAEAACIKLSAKQAYPLCDRLQGRG